MKKSDEQVSDYAGHLSGYRETEFLYVFDLKLFKIFGNILYNLML